MIQTNFFYSSLNRDKNGKWWNLWAEHKQFPKKASEIEFLPSTDARIMFWHLSSSCCLCDGERSRMKTHVGLHHEHASTYMISFRRPRYGSGVISTSTPTHKISSPSNVSARREFSFLRISFMTTFPKSNYRNLFVYCFANKYLALYTRALFGSVWIFYVFISMSAAESESWSRTNKKKSKSNNCCSFPLTGPVRAMSLRRQISMARHCWLVWRWNPSRDRMK